MLRRRFSCHNHIVSAAARRIPLFPTAEKQTQRHHQSDVIAPEPPAAPLKDPPAWDGPE
jgi:hypothetical protein